MACINGLRAAYCASSSLLRSVTCLLCVCVFSFTINKKKEAMKTDWRQQQGVEGPPGCVFSTMDSKTLKRFFFFLQKPTAFLFFSETKLRRSRPPLPFFPPNESCAFVRFFFVCFVCLLSLFLIVILNC